MRLTRYDATVTEMKHDAGVRLGEGTYRTYPTRDNCPLSRILGGVTCGNTETCSGEVDTLSRVAHTGG